MVLKGRADMGKIAMKNVEGRLRDFVRHTSSAWKTHPVFPADFPGAMDVTPSLRV